MKIYLTIDRRDNELTVHFGGGEPKESGDVWDIHQAAKTDFIDYSCGSVDEEYINQIKSEGRETPAGWIMELKSEVSELRPVLS